MSGQVPGSVSVAVGENGGQIAGVGGGGGGGQRGSIGSMSGGRGSMSGTIDDDKRDRRKHPCVLCQQRKVKCDRNYPCANCTKARVECISPTTLPPKRRKKRFPEAELLARLRRYEDVLRSYGADIDAINNGEAVTQAPVSHAGQVKMKFEPESNGHDGGPHPVRSLAIRRSLKHVKNNMFPGVNEEFQDAEDILQGSSDDELYAEPITRTYDAIKSDGDDILFPSPMSESLRDLHPSPVHIFRLWQSFLDNVNPLTKIFHAPTIQQQILDASADLDNLSKPLEALMFGLYSIAVTSMTEADCVTIFGEEKVSLKSRYQAGARQALHRAGLLRTSSMMILQAFVLYLLSCLNFSVDPRALFCMTGIATRIAQRMGLNFDGTTYGLLPFETEMRRRIWWNLLLLDFRVSELSGAGCMVLTHNWSTRLPLNVNDSDLYPDMKEPPLEHPGRVTEMVFLLQRCEAGELLQKVRGGCESAGSLAAKDKLIDGLAQRIEEKYLRNCDSSVPLHLMTSLMARSGINKLHLGPRHPHLLSKNLESEDADRLFILSLEMLENHNILMGTPSLKCFHWHILTNFPFPAHVYILCQLRYRTTGLLADRAWEKFEISADLRMALWSKESRKQRDSVLHTALANLTVKAWQAREKAHPGIRVPRFITHMREVVAIHVSKKSPKTGSTLESDIDTSPAISDLTDNNQVTDFGDQGWFQQPMLMGDSGMGMGMGVGDGFDNMQGLMGSSDQGVGWEFWNDLMQVPPNSTGWDGGMSSGSSMYPIQ